MAKGKYHEWLEPDSLLKLEAWARDGLSQAQIAENIGICEDTLYTWKKKYPEISESLKKGKEVVDIQLENAMMKKALGYKYQEATKELVDGKLQITKVVMKEAQPDSVALKFLLINRMGDKWKSKQDVDMTGNLEIVFEDDYGEED